MHATYWQWDAANRRAHSPRLQVAARWHALQCNDGCPMRWRVGDLASSSGRRRILEAAEAARSLMRVCAFRAEIHAEPCRFVAPQASAQRKGTIYLRA